MPRPTPRSWWPATSPAATPPATRPRLRSSTALPGTVVPAGDLVYEDGTPAQFDQCYDPTWGRHKARTRPAIGGHEYRTPGAAGYFSYWGTPPAIRRGLLQLRPRLWHVITLNAECDFLAAAACADSPQIDWLAGSGREPGAMHRRGLPRAALQLRQLPRAGLRHVPLLAGPLRRRRRGRVSGDDHSTSASRRRRPTAPDDEHGIRQFVAGTGGRSHYGFNAPMPNSQVRNANTYGILQLQLHPNSYDFNFVPEAGGTFTDSGSGSCHDDPPPTPRITFPDRGRDARLRDAVPRGRGGMAPDTIPRSP